MDQAGAENAHRTQQEPISSDSTGLSRVCSAPGRMWMTWQKMLMGSPQWSAVLHDHGLDADLVDADDVPVRCWDQMDAQQAGVMGLAVVRDDPTSDETVAAAHFKVIDNSGKMESVEILDRLPPSERGLRTRQKLEMRICAYCGAPFRSRAALKYVACSNECRLSHRTSTAITMSCVVCGGAVTRKRSYAVRYPTSTCSRACFRRYCSTMRKAPVRTVERKCLVCGKVFSVKWFVADHERNVSTCSNPCRIQLLNSRPRPVRTENCRTCGLPFARPPGHAIPTQEGKPRGFWCSRSCMWLDDDYRKRRAVRHIPSNLEAVLFAALVETSVLYVPFATVGKYVADALLPTYDVILEVDGTYWHRGKTQYDAARDAALTKMGYTVIHYSELDLHGGRGPKARQILVHAIDEIVRGKAAYRPPTLWREESMVMGEYGAIVTNSERHAIVEAARQAGHNIGPAVVSDHAIA